MPIYPEVVDNKYILLRGEGPVTGSEILEINKRLYTEPAYKNAARFQLWDLTALTSVKMNVRDQQEAARQDEEALGSYAHIVVAIAGTADQVYGISRMYAGYAPDGVSTMAFRDLHEARSWMLAQVEQTTTAAQG